MRQAPDHDGRAVARPGDVEPGAAPSSASAIRNAAAPQHAASRGRTGRVGCTRGPTAWSLVTRPLRSSSAVVRLGTCVDERRRIHEDLGTLDWADWAPDGALLFGRDGCLFHQRGREARLVADLDGQVFERMPPPPEGLQWPAYLRRRGRR